MRIWIALMLSSGVALAEPPAPVLIKSATAASASDGAAWKVVATTRSTWCQAKAGLGPGEPFTIALATPAKISRVDISAPLISGHNTLGSAEVTADGKVYKANRTDIMVGSSPTGRATIDVALGGGPVSQLVVKVVASVKGPNEVNCVDAIELVTPNEASVIYGVEPAAASSLWPSATRIRDALGSCDSKELAAMAKLPVVRHWTTMTDDGLKDHSTKLETAAALAKACKKKQLQDTHDAMKLGNPHVEAIGPTRVRISENAAAWDLVLDGDHWRLRELREDL